jgi:hypothetical protein
MCKTILRGVLCLAVLLSAVGGVSAQEKPPPAADEPAPTPTIEELQRQVEELTRQLAIVQKQLEEMKAQQEEERRQAELGELRQAAQTEAATTTETEEVDTTTKFVSGTRMQSMLNPEISVTGDIFFVGGEHEKEEMLADHFELDIQSYLDPFTRMHLVVGYHGPEHESSFGAEDDEEEVHSDEGFGIGEGYITWLQLPGHTSLTVGKKRQQFGVLNRWHRHALDQADWPWAISESFGEHGLVGTGVSMDWLMPRLWADTNELTVEIMNGNNDVAFAGSDWTKPTWRELYRGFTARGMILRSWLDREDVGSLDSWGSYLYGQCKFASRWIGGLRWDWIEDQRVADHETWGLTPYLTFWQSEFVRLRGEFTYERDNLFGTDRRFDLQITFAAGPHKHESY